GCLNNFCFKLLSNFLGALQRGTSGVTVMWRAWVPIRLEIAQKGAFLAATRAVIGDDAGE
ncbi:hypothetical protein, partial [Gemmiger formicilis]|uniref:hypothetical protein n=1 Tax=Gemmiger formicilis TaxID=745368 RepID=UPI0022E2FCBB